MLIYKNQDALLSVSEGTIDDIEGAVWLDIFNPDESVVQKICRQHNFELPSLADIDAGRLMPRLSRTDKVDILKSRIVTKQGDWDFDTTTVIFIITPKLIITLRAGEPDCFDELHTLVQKQQVDAVQHPEIIFFLLMSSVASQYSVGVQRMGDALNKVSHEIFTQELDGQNSDRHKDQIDVISRVEDLNSKLMSSLMELTLIGDYFESLPEDQFRPDRLRFQSNVSSLTGNCQFISDRIDFVLNTVMSVINLEQNSVVNVFSVFSVIFTIPALLAGIWGMNFQSMPELSWPMGYFVALIVMFLAGALPYWFVKKMGWL